MAYVVAVVSLVLGIVSVAFAVATYVCLSKRVAMCREKLEAAEKSLEEAVAASKASENAARETASSIEDIKIDVATAKAMMFAYEAKLKGEQGLWCLEHEGNKKWYSPGKLKRTESADGKKTTEFSYDESTENVCATSKSEGKVKSSITFSKFGLPLFGIWHSDGAGSRKVKYNKLGQVEK